MPVSSSSRSGYAGAATLRLISLVAIISSGLALGAHGAALAQHRTAAPFVDTGTVTFVRSQLAGDIDPASNESEFGATVIRNIDENLVRLAGSSPNSFEPALATSWSHNAAESVWTFHLRHGVRFHSGRAMTAADVQYSLARSVLANQAALPALMSEIDTNAKVREYFERREEEWIATIRAVLESAVQSGDAPEQALGREHVLARVLADVGAEHGPAGLQGLLDERVADRGHRAAVRAALARVKADGTPIALLPSLLAFDEFLDFIGLPEVRELEQRFAEE